MAGTHSDVQVSGVVVHSSFSASDIVFFDRNGNRKWDNGEPSANIDPDGHYAINNDMDAIATNAPKVMNSIDGLSGYQFHNDSSQLHGDD